MFFYIKLVAFLSKAGVNTLLTILHPNLNSTLNNKKIMVFVKKVIAINFGYYELRNV